MSFCVQQNRLLIIAGGAVLFVIFYLYRVSVIQEQQNSIVQSSLSETNELLRDLMTFTKNHSKCASDPLAAPPPPQNKDEFTVGERGFWQGLGATNGHVFDSSLAKALVSFFQAEKVATLLELGAGTGAYAKEFKTAGIFRSCYDGNPQTQDLSEGRCGMVDLSKPLDFSKHDWTLSLEVGEHIPQDFEDIFISNLVNSNNHGMIISWAIIGQGGTSHVNNRNNSYIRDRIVSNGYNSDFEAEKMLREAATDGYWFKDTIMVFRKRKRERKRERKRKLTLKNLNKLGE